MKKSLAVKIVNLLKGSVYNDDSFIVTLVDLEQCGIRVVMKLIDGELEINCQKVFEVIVGLCLLYGESPVVKEHNKYVLKQSVKKKYMTNIEVPVTRTIEVF
jgi:hypothetical protein